MFDYDQSNKVHPEPLMTEKIFSDRKTFFLDLKENDRGRFLKITEDVRGRRDTIMLPADSFQDFYEAMGRILDFNDGEGEGESDEEDDDYEN